MDCYKNPIEGVYVFLDMDDKVLESNDKGIVKIKDNMIIKSFEVHYLGEVYKYEILNTNANFFKVSIFIRDLSKTYFDKENFKFKNNTISNNKLFKYFKVDSQ